MKIRVDKMPDTPMKASELFDRISQDLLWLVVFEDGQGKVESHTFGDHSQERLEVLERIVAAYRERVEWDRTHM